MCLVDCILVAAADVLSLLQSRLFKTFLIPREPMSTICM